MSASFFPSIGISRHLFPIDSFTRLRLHDGVAELTERLPFETKVFAMVVTEHPCFIQANSSLFVKELLICVNLDDFCNKHIVRWIFFDFQHLTF